MSRWARGQETARSHAVGSDRHSSSASRHLRDGDARSGRGDDHGGRIAIMNRGKFVADRRAGRDLRASEQPLQRRIYRLGQRLRLRIARAPRRCADPAKPRVAPCDQSRSGRLGGGRRADPGGAATGKILLCEQVPEDGCNFAVGEVAHISYLGDLSIYHVKLHSGQIISAQLQNGHRFRKGMPTWGDEVRLCWETDSCVVLTV